MLECVQCVLSSVTTEAECNSGPTHHNIYSNQAANAAALHSSQFEQSISPTGRRAELTRYRIARFARTVRVFFLTPSARSFCVAAGLTRGQGDGPGVGWENQLYRNSSVPQPGTHAADGDAERAAFRQVEWFHA